MNRRRPFPHGAPGRDPRKALLSSRTQRPQNATPAAPPPTRASSARLGTRAHAAAARSAPPDDEPWDPFSVTSGDVEDASGGSRDSIFSGADEWPAPAEEASFGSSAFGAGDASFGNSSGGFGGGSFGESSWSSFRPVASTSGYAHDKQGRVIDWPSSPQLSPIAPHDSLEAETSLEASVGEMSPQTTPLRKNGFWGALDASDAAEGPNDGDDMILVSLSPEEPRESNPVSPARRRARAIVQKRSPRRGLALTESNEKAQSRRQREPLPASPPSHKAGKRPLEPPAAAPAETDGVPAALGTPANTKGRARPPPAGPAPPRSPHYGKPPDIHSKRSARPQSSEGSPEAPPSMTSTARPRARPPSTTGSLDAWHRRQEQLQLRQGITKPGQRPGREPGSVATNHSVLTDEMSAAQLARRKGGRSAWQGQIAARQRQVLEPPRPSSREVWSSEEEAKPKNATANGADSVGESGVDDDSGTWAMADVTLSSLEGGDPFRAGASPKRTLWEGGLPSRQSHEQVAAPTEPTDAAAPTSAPQEEGRPEFAPDEVEPPPQQRGERTKQSAPQRRRLEGSRASNEIIGATRGLVMAGLVDNAPPEAARTRSTQQAPLSTRGVYRRTHPSARALPARGANKPPLGPSPTSIADTTVMRLPSGARPLASPVRSDHSADAAAGATPFGAAGLRDVRRQIFSGGNPSRVDTGGEGAAVAEKTATGKAPTVREVLRDDGADLDLRNVQAIYRSPGRREDQVINMRVSQDGEHGGSAGGSPNRPRAAAVFQNRAAASPPGGVARTVSWDDDSAPQPNLDAPPSQTEPSAIGPARSFDSAANSVRSHRSRGSRGSRWRGTGSQGGAPAGASTQSVASAAPSVAPSVETECVRQNAEIAQAMDDMMEFFMDAAASGGDGDGTDSVSIEGRGWGDGDHGAPAAPDAHFDPRHPLPAEEAPFDVAPFPPLDRSAEGTAPPTVTPLRSNRMPHGTAVTAISNLMLFPSPSEEYDDPSVFAHSILSEASSDLAPAVPPREPPSRPAPAAAPSNRDSLGFPKGNHEPAEINGTGAKKDLSNFFDQFSDRLIHGCHDGEGESSDVFFVDNGWNAGNWGDQALSNEWKADPAVSQTLQRARLDAADRALPPASTFLSPKDRAKIRQHDTTPLRGNTARSRRMAGAHRSHVSYPSVHSIQESAHEDDEEESREIVDDDQSSDYTACSGSDRSSDDGSSGGASSGEGSSEGESGYGAQGSPASGDSPHRSARRESRSPLDSALDEPDSPPTPPALQRSLLEPFEEKKEDPPDGSFAEDHIDPDTMKMTYREKRKGHSLAWHSSNGVNDNELYDSKQLPPSRAQRASTIAGRLNLLTISSLTAETFQDHFGDDDSSHNPLYSLASDRAVNDESQLGSILGSIREEESFERLSEDDDESVEDGEEEESDYVQMLRDFKDIIQRAGKKAVGGESEEDTAVRPKKQQSPVTTPAADRAAGGYGPARRVPTPPHQSTKASPKPSRALASHPSPGYMPARYQMSHGPPAVQRRAPVRARGGVPPLHRQTRQNYHPHQVPRGQELTKSRLEEKLLGISGGVHRKHCGDSVATSELGSLLTRDSERSQIGNVGVPTMIFHRTHPGVRATDGVLAAKASPESCRSSPSSMQNTYNGSVAGLARTPKGNVSVPRNRIYLPEDMVDDAAPPVANQGQRPATASSPARRVNVNEAKVDPPRNTKQEHYKAAAAAIAKIDEELRNSNRQKVPAFPPAVARTPSAPPKPPTGKPPTSGDNMVGSGTKAVQIQVNRVRSEPKRVAARAPVEPLPKGPEMQRSRSAFVGSATAMKPRQMQRQNKPVRPSNAVEVVGPPSLGKARSYGSKPAAQPVRKQRSMDPVIPHSSGKKQFGVQPVVTTRRDSNSNASTRALFLATSSSTLQAENLSTKQQPKIPASFNSSRSIRRNMVTPDNTSQHSSIFEAFEVAPLRTFSDDADDQKDANAFLNYVGVHHSFTRKGSKRVGFPTPPGAVAHPIADAYPLRSKNATAQRAQSQSNKGEGFEVILPKRQPRPPPPPPVTPAAGSSHPQGNSQRNRMRQKMRAGWKRMVHPGTSSSNNGTAATARANKVGPRATANTKRGGCDPPGSLAG